ncbi:hypothetical protein SASPL_134366 [Salvia splendens]|uniref:DUF7870 domain-containing protein n=1 Tax=Salvia splendens TaxID=180675 RepID=A0A8X8ZIU4_SALSN|nr:uncharacterized protein LOC121757901 [Salvia splendens]KAG6406757.1 hypothetical protein SASPL_134366 [Salvia splendens]
MDKSGRARRIKSGGSDIDEPDEFEIGMNYDAVFVVKLPDSRSLRVVSRSLFLAVVLLSLPSIGSIIQAASNEGVISDWIENLPLLLRDLEDEGLLAEGHRGFVVAAGEVDFAFLRNAGVDFSMKADAHQVFDYIYAPNFSGIELVEDAIRGGGLAIAPLGGDISAEIRLLHDFKIVYLRRINGNTVVAMRKNSAAIRYSGGRRGVICGGIGGGGKKEAALKGLEGVYLEPPRVEKESRFNYLPDLMEDPLDGYRRRVFVADEDGAVDWFYKNYPMRGQEFEVYGVEGEWDWGAEDFVVVKVEARAAERMLREKTICVVDELFLDCREEEGRAYWNCVELYGKIRSEGIAVHQWWF